MLLQCVTEHFEDERISAAQARENVKANTQRPAHYITSSLVCPTCRLQCRFS